MYDPRLVLISLLIKLGIAAAVSSALARSRVFKRLLFAEDRTAGETIGLLACICIPLTLGVWARVTVPNFLAADIAFETTVILGVLLGPWWAAVGGAFLSLSYPGSWNQGLSSGQGLMAVALVIFARWDPLRCIAAALLFGAAGALGPSLQSIGITQGYYFFNAAPYILTLVIMIATSSAKHSARDMPGELSMAK